MFGNRGLEILDELFEFYKNSGDFFLISKWFDNTEIVQELFEDWIYNFLTYMRANFLQSFL